MMSNIKSTVIIPVYSRKDCIEDALLSLENQRTSKGAFEVIVVSNIPLMLSREFDLDLRIVLSDRPTLAGKLFQGITMANNEIITFLEDDDLYVDDRIPHLSTVFSTNEDLIYYHNNSIHFRHFYHRGTHLLDRRQYSRASGLDRLLKWQDDMTGKEDIKFLLDNRADYNFSSMALRKDVIIDFADVISGQSRSVTQHDSQI